MNVDIDRLIQDDLKVVMEKIEKAFIELRDTLLSIFGTVKEALGIGKSNKERMREFLQANHTPRTIGMHSQVMNKRPLMTVARDSL